MPLQLDFYPLETFEDVQDAQQLNESGSFEKLGDPGISITNNSGLLGWIENRLGTEKIVNGKLCFLDDKHVNSLLDDIDTVLLSHNTAQILFPHATVADEYPIDTQDLDDFVCCAEVSIPDGYWVAVLPRW